MPLVAPEEGWVWLSVPLHECVDVVVLGEIHSWFTHWYRGPQCRGSLAVRCVKEERGDCDWCRAEYQRRVRYVFPVRVDDQVRCCELGAPQYPSLSAISTFERWVGSRLRLARERPVKNAPILVRRIGEEVVPPEAVVDCSGLVAGLGLSNLRMLDVSRVLADIESPGDQRARKRLV